jgi:hypothetical protein
MNSNLSSIVSGIEAPALRVAATLEPTVGAVCSFLGSNFRLICNQHGFGSPSESRPDLSIQRIPLALGKHPVALGGSPR